MTPTTKSTVQVGLLLVALLGGVVAPSANSAPRWAEGRILMAPRQGVPEQVVLRMAENADAQAIERIGRLSVRVLSVSPGQEQRTVDRLRRNPQVAFAELDTLAEPTAFLPDDPNFGSAWHLGAIGAPVAWELSAGEGITVAILDSGVLADHVDLADNVLPGWNSVSRNDEATDVSGHGTRVAGTVAALTDNGVGVAAIAYEAKILPVRVSNRADGWAYWSDIARGLSWAAEHGARVANISYDATGSAAITSAAQAMREQGGLVVVSAGNTGGDPGYSPNPHVISVSATTNADTRPGWSAFGDYVDFAAPGVGIWTTTINDGYSAPSGTTFSSSILAAVVAQMMSVNGDLDPDAIESILQRTVVDLGEPGWDPSYGFGRIDAAAAVAAAYADSTNGGPVPTDIGHEVPAVPFALELVLGVLLGWRVLWTGRQGRRINARCKNHAPPRR